MTPDHEISYTIDKIVVDVSPSKVDAAGDLTLKVSVSCLPELVLQGQMLLIRDHNSVDMGSAELIKFHNGINETDEITLKAPATIGTYSWSVVYLGEIKGERPHEEIVERFDIIVKPHGTQIVVWDTPSTAVVGESFYLKVGLKCSRECNMEGRDFKIFDSTGALATTGRLNGDSWPGSNALYFAEAKIEAPATEGLSRWEVRVAAGLTKADGRDVEIAHEECASTFRVTVVPSPEALVRVRVIDHAEQRPLRGASVVMHPYRAVTDDSGWAEIWAARGQYQLLVSQSKYLARSLSTKVIGDFTTIAELDPEPVVNPYDI